MNKIYSITIVPDDITYEKIVKLSEEKKWSKAKTGKVVLNWAFSKNVELEDL